MPFAFTEQLCLFISFLPDSGNRMGPLTKVQKVSLPQTPWCLKGAKSSPNPPIHSLTPSRVGQGTAACTAALERGYWPTQTSAETEHFTFWKAVLESRWDATSKSCPQGCPTWPHTRNITSLAPGLGQGHFYWEHWGAGKAARLVTAAYKKGIQQ